MSFAPGTRFGPYEVTSPLGAGGMGEVYRARDQRLGRDVALKVLSSVLTDDADRLIRFKREARVLASLNHPNIAALYGLEDGPLSSSEHPVEALVLELVEGPTLAQRLARGPLPLDEVRAIGIQIAAALEAAHEQSIVHRDLKPANIKVRPDGTVKVLDFGLAKAWEPPSSEPADVSASPTLASPAMTGAGIILGTAAYMSPEQARGAAVDKRTDVWAFGCVLFEMLSGRHVFGAPGTVSEAIAAVLKSDPDWAALPANTPPHIRLLLKRCLEKDPRRRLRDIGDAGLLLSESAEDERPGADSRRPELPAISSRGRNWAAVAGWSAAVLMAIVNAVWMAGIFRPAPATAPVPLRLTIPLASPLTLGTVLRRFAVSSDGTRVVYVGRDDTGSSLYLQNLATGDVKRLPETDGAGAPAFSPDGRTIGFVTRRAIRILPLEGGLPRDIPHVESMMDWAWSGSDHILVTGPTGLARVAVDGGSPEAIAKPAPDEALFSSVFPLPGGAYVLSTRAGLRTDGASRVVVVTPGDSTRLLIAERGGSPSFVAGDRAGVGHIVYADAGRLLAVPFDEVRRVVKGGAVPIVQNVDMRPNGEGANYGVSSTGTLVFGEASLHELVSIDRETGAVHALSTSLRQFALPRLSPDARRLAMEIQDSPHQIWMLDIDRDVLVPLTTDASGAHNFAWSPDGSAIIYSLGDIKPPQFGWVRTNGSISAERIVVAADSNVMVANWSRTENLSLRGGDGPKPTVMTLRLEGGTPPKASGAPLKIADGLPGPFSPDGSWLAYCDCGSSGDRPANVFIYHLASGTTHQVSIDGGFEPVWSASGRELFFRAGSKMMAADLTFEGTSARIGRPRALFEGDYLEWASANYDVTANGKTFIMVRTATANARTLSVRLNWMSEIQRLAPHQP